MLIYSSAILSLGFKRIENNSITKTHTRLFRVTLVTVAETPTCPSGGASMTK